MRIRRPPTGVPADPLQGGESCGSKGEHEDMILNAITNFLHRDDEEGQGLAEYALILALIAIVAIIALLFLGGAISKVLSTVGSSI